MRKRIEWWPLIIIGGINVNGFHRHGYRIIYQGLVKATKFWQDNKTEDVDRCNDFIMAVRKANELFPDVCPALYEVGDSTSYMLFRGKNLKLYEKEFMEDITHGTTTGFKIRKCLGDRGGGFLDGCITE